MPLVSFSISSIAVGTTNPTGLSTVIFLQKYNSNSSPPSSYQILRLTRVCPRDAPTCRDGRWYVHKWKYWTAT